MLRTQTVRVDRHVCLYCRLCMTLDDDIYTTANIIISTNKNIQLMLE